MNEDDRRFLRDWDDQLTPTVKAHFEEVKAFARVPICVACPAAQWYKREERDGKGELQCFCTAYRSIMFAGGSVITACDARADALGSREQDPV